MNTISKISTSRKNSNDIQDHSSFQFLSGFEEWYVFLLLTSSLSILLVTFLGFWENAFNIHLFVNDLKCITQV